MAFGTEHLAARSVAAGATIVRLDESVLPLAGPADLGRTYFYRVGPAYRDHADPSYLRLAASVGASALLPLSPVHPRARRMPDGVEISWIRRTRAGGDSWDFAEIPLGEAGEAYRIDILDGGGALRRTLSAPAPLAIYPAVQELADFGAPQSSLKLRIVQMSAAVGPGLPLQAAVSVG